jgi:DNA repair ATPase RecN
MVAGGRGHGVEASSSRAGRSAQVEGVAGDPPAFADAQGEQELELRARDKYAAFDQVSAELRQLREQCGAFDALADALRTPDSWLSYGAMALRDQLHESVRQDPAHPSTLERVCTALIDRDEALRQARADLEKTCTLAANWEVEVAGVRNDNRELRSSLQGAQARQSQVEERARALEQRAKEADDLKAALDAKVTALAVAEDQLLRKRTARQGGRGAAPAGAGRPCRRPVGAGAGAHRSRSGAEVAGGPEHRVLQA